MSDEKLTALQALFPQFKPILPGQGAIGSIPGVQKILERQQRILERQKEQEECLEIARFEKLLSQLVEDFRAFRPNPLPEPCYPLGLPEVILQKTRLWFDGYRKRVSRRHYLKAVNAYERANLKNLKDQSLLFPPLTKEDLQYRSCLKDPALPVLKHVKPGAGRRPHGTPNQLYVLIRKFWFEANQRMNSNRIHYVLNKLQKKRVLTGNPKYGSRWPEFYEAQPSRVWKLKQLAFNSRYAEID